MTWFFKHHKNDDIAEANSVTDGTGIEKTHRVQDAGPRYGIEPPEAARERRVASVRRIAGIWADRTDIPADGLEYERTLRDEWR
jgi:hypothetical protein